MKERLSIAYTNYRWIRIAAGGGLVLSAILLFELDGGMPPWAWRFLLQVLPRLGLLWSVRGPGLLPALIALLLLSLALVLLWFGLVYAAVKMVSYWWQSRGEHQSFSRDLAEAEHLATQMVAAQQSGQKTKPRLAWRSQSQDGVTRSFAWSLGKNADPPAAYATAGVASGRATAAIARVSTPLPAVGKASVPLASMTPPVVTERVTPPVAPHVAVRQQLRLVPRIFDQTTKQLDAAELAAEEHMSPLQQATGGFETRTLSPNSEPGPTAITEQTEAVRLLVGIGLDPGLKRKDAPNEDNLFAIQAMRTTKSGQQPVGLFVICDGMGGHLNGQEASRVAIQAISDVVVPAMLHVSDDEDSFSDLLKDGVHRANLALYKRNKDQPDIMGTTLTAALVVGRTAYIANVGDSRTYLYQPLEGLKQITRDHSIVARLVEDGAIKRDEIYTHPHRNQIYRCLGDHASVEVDCFIRKLQIDDILVLCSDGLWEMVRDPDLCQLIEVDAPHGSQISSTLVQSALNNGGADNISVVVICIAEPEEDFLL